MEIDRIKEHIGALKSYLNIIVALILAFGAGMSKLYLTENVGVLFWLAIFLIVLLIFLSVFIAKKIHDYIESLKDL